MSLATAVDPRAASPFAPDDLTVAVGEAAAAVANLSATTAHPVATGTGEIALRLTRGAPGARELGAVLGTLDTRIGLLAIDPDVGLLNACLQALCRDATGVALDDPVVVAIPRAAADSALEAPSRRSATRRAARKQASATSRAPPMGERPASEARWRKGKASGGSAYGGREVCTGGNLHGVERAG